MALLLLSVLGGAASGQSVISIADPNLEAAVRSMLGKPTGELSSTDMLALPGVNAPNQGISSLAGLEWAVNLEYLNLENNSISDAAPLAGLTNLRYLFLDGNRLSSGAALAGLTNLQALLLDYNSIQDVSWLAGLTQLRSLGLMFNPLSSATVIAGLTNLTLLHLNGTGTSDVGFLRGLNNLTELGLGDNGIRDGSPLAGLTKLEFLGLGGSAINNWDFMLGLTNLRTLYLFSDSISDASFLGGLRNLTWLRLSDNNLRDVSPLAGLSQLQYLDLSWNQLGSCPALAGLTSLTNLDLRWNALTNVSGLSGLSSLTALELSHNQLRDAAPLGSLTGLQSLDLATNRLANLDFLQGLTALTSLLASHNRLTDINGLLGAVNLRSVALEHNLLLLTTGSPAQNVIQTLQSRGVTVDASSQSLPYVATNGTYTGLVYPAGALTQSNSGCITLTASAARRYSGKLQFGGASYSLSGSFNIDGLDTKTVQRGKQRPLLVNLEMQGADYLTGTISAAGQTSSADMLGYRMVADGKSKLSPQAGRYTMVIAGSNSPALPAGDGYGTFTVSPAGKLKLVGSLADGTKFTQAASVSWDGQWPLYVPLYSGKGVALGWMAFTNAQSLNGELAWVKPKDKSKRYPDGFAWVSPAAGARYYPPGKGTNAFGCTSCDMTLTLTGGDLKQALASQFTLNAKNQVKALPTGSKLTVTFTPATGVFKGRAVEPMTHKSVSFSGVILQNQTNGCGFLLGTSTSGQALLW